ncbi:hypothetical protein CPLU01_03105 [Colletotrichum plurivorum]|uniref:Uncharacterized protein n=1 Tax=Colletotrichum plurivorum TaxID=2175906 RepID=A0A8H6NM43_9PEZI|nr:hypothetical protein CPLU01_03105 [Colletotrichum plurivorum]
MSRMLRWMAQLAGNVAQQPSAQLCKRVKQFVTERRIEHYSIKNRTTVYLAIEEKKEATRELLQAICKPFCDEDPTASSEQPHQSSWKLTRENIRKWDESQ